MRVLSALHSSAGEVDKMWNVGDEKFKNIPRIDTGYPLKGARCVNEILEVVSAPTHSFKFSKIQTWINDITKIDVEENYPMNKSRRHNMLSGCSTVIESIFAKLRDSIVKKYGASSIIIDGGGRIKFSSSSPAESVKKYIEKYNRIHRTIMKYVELSRNIQNMPNYIQIYPNKHQK